MTTTARAATGAVREHRCPECDRFLGRSQAAGWVEYFCPRCKRIRRFFVGEGTGVGASTGADQSGSGATGARD